MGHAMLVFTCAACGKPAQANPTLVMSIPARWDGTQYVADPDASREPICETCAHRLLDRFECEGLSMPMVVREADYFERAYHHGAQEQEM